MWGGPASHRNPLLTSSLAERARRTASGTKLPPAEPSTGDGGLREIMRTPGKMPIEPELYLRDGRIIRSLADAIALLREHEARPGVDVRDEVLHRLERAHNEAEQIEAVGAFVAWAEELDLLLAPPEIAPPRT